MIRCTIEILPGGSESRARIIGCVEIANIGGSPEIGNYVCVLKKTPPFPGALKAAWRKARIIDDGHQLIGRSINWREDDEVLIAEIQGHHRRRRGVYDLLYRALKACGLEDRVQR
jgi:hypothetical protein